MLPRVSDPLSEPESNPESIADEPSLGADRPEVGAGIMTTTRTEPQSIVPVEPEPLAGKPHELLRTYAATSTPVPAAELNAANFVWGLAQPLLGLRVLARNSDLAIRAVLPVLGFIGICLLVVEKSGGVVSWITGYYLTLIAAAPLSPILFCRNYARLAALARPHLGLEPREPYLRSIRQILSEAFVQLLVVGVGVAPLAGLIAVFPLVGPIWAAVLGYLWAMHWVVVEALDSAKTLSPGETLPAQTQPDSLERPLAWFATPTTWRLPGRANILLAPVRWWSRWLGRLGSRWHGEIEIIERHPWLASGFALGAALLLAIPVLNLLFRPAIVIAAAHVLGRLEPEGRAALAA